ncbi:MAG: M56 family metallopeptidase [Sphingopyxis sp.]|nr:M56 family metallopeptidase [Sphingopyxis sp.]
MSAATLFQVWIDTLVTTAVLVMLVLAVRKPFARHFGPRLTYALWAVPALRLVLPPVPVADPVAAATTPEAVMMVPDTLPVGAPTAIAEPLWSFADMLPFLFVLWAAGVVAVILIAMVSHQRFRGAVLEEAVELQPIGAIRLVMTDAIDGPVAFGLWQRHVAVPHDFFARYNADERALAIDHELAHHRHGDLWANGAALILLAAQWFNPFAWRAIRAFRFDQEAACDARVLTMAEADARGERTARYANAIVKAAGGRRLTLAAPMAVHDNLRERLTMLTRQDISRRRGMIGRFIVGGTALAVLATTATLVPASIANASTGEPEPLDATTPLSAPVDGGDNVDSEVTVVISTSRSTSNDGSASKTSKTRDVHRLLVRRDGAEAAIAARPAPAAPDARPRSIEIRTSGGLSRGDVLAALKEQGITGSRANAIADRLEAKRSERMRLALAPMPPMAPVAPTPPVAPMPRAAMAVQGKAVVARCGDGRTAPIVDREESSRNRRSRVTLFTCSDPVDGKAAGVAALRKVRDAFAKRRGDDALSESIAVKVIADIDEAIAKAEKSER